MTFKSSDFFHNLSTWHTLRSITYFCGILEGGKLSSFVTNSQKALLKCKPFVRQYKMAILLWLVLGVPLPPKDKNRRRSRALSWLSSEPRPNPTEVQTEGALSESFPVRRSSSSDRITL